MNPTHTPAPWVQEFTVPHGSADGFWQIRAPQADNVVVCDLAETAEIDANASLIAAAPELLANCEQLVKMAEDYLSGRLVLWPASVLPQARAAIEKARGQS